jgi:NodT family efflux transporter outer membrane factor (OMF) lipoprotein
LERRGNLGAQLARSLIAGAALTTVGGCAMVGPDYQVPALSLPPAWSNSAAGETPMATERREDLSRWWERLDDPILTGLIAQALEANLDLRSAQARLRESRARRDFARAQLSPSVTGSAAASGTRISDTDTTIEFYTVGFDATWEIDVFGGRRRALEAAEADLRSSADTLDATRVTLAAEVARNYVDVRAFQTRLAIARDNLTSQSETLQLTEWRREAGLVGSLDVEQARANREQTRAQLPSLDTSVAEAQHRLAILLGLPPGTLQERLAAAGAIPAAPAQIAIGIPADVLRQRPDVRAAERTLAAETARIGQAEAARYPSFQLSGAIRLDAASLHALTSGATALGSLLAGVTAPIFDAGRLRQLVEIQREVQVQAQVSYESTVLTALEEVENALVGFGNSLARRAALAEARTAARNAALLARYRYSAGLIDFQVVLDTERSVLTIEDSLATSEADRVLALIQLYKALGGGWTPAADAGSDAPAADPTAQQRTSGSAQ